MHAEQISHGPAKNQHFSLQLWTELDVVFFAVCKVNYKIAMLHKVGSRNLQGSLKNFQVDPSKLVHKQNFTLIRSNIQQLKKYFIPQQKDKPLFILRYS